MTADEYRALPHYVYRFWSGATCLYVGCTGQLGTRLTAHARREWWGEVDRVEIDRHDDCATAETAERALIEQLQPVHNRVFTKHFLDPGGWSTRRANLEAARA